MVAQQILREPRAGAGAGIRGVLAICAVVATAQVANADRPGGVMLVELDGVASGVLETLETGLRKDKRFASVERLAVKDAGAELLAKQTPSNVGTFLRQRERDIAIFVLPSGQAQIWLLPKKTRFARRVGGAPANQPAYVLEQIDRWQRQQRASEQVDDLLREKPGDRERNESPSTRWWVYVAVGGAVAAAGALIIADGLAQDRQRIELTAP